MRIWNFTIWAIYQLFFKNIAYVISQNHYPIIIERIVPALLVTTLCYTLTIIITYKMQESYNQGNLNLILNSWTSLIKIFLSYTQLSLSVFTMVLLVLPI